MRDTLPRDTLLDTRWLIEFLSYVLRWLRWCLRYYDRFLACHTAKEDAYTRAQLTPSTAYYNEDCIEEDFAMLLLHKRLNFSHDANAASPGRFTWRMAFASPLRGQRMYTQYSQMRPFSAMDRARCRRYRTHTQLMIMPTEVDDVAGRRIM